MFSAKNELFTRPSGANYQLFTRSLRFRSSASAYLNRVFTSSATWTISLWCKRGALGAISPLFGDIKFNANDTFTAGSLTTSTVYRDPTAWYHIVVTSSNAYVNGVSIGSLTSTALVSPRIGSNVTNYFDGYMAEINFIDGQALAPAAFGALNSYNQWQPITYSGSYGTTGFRLPFTNNASTTTLGYDFSPNGNNWTTNNISVTAGNTYDSMTDVPTLTSATAANFDVMSPLWPASYSNGALSNANLTTLITAISSKNCFAAQPLPTSGKFYYELTSTYSGSGMIVGVTATPSGNDPATAGSNVFGYYNANGNKYNNGTGTAYGTTWYTSGQTYTIGVAYDADAGTLVFYLNNTSQGTAFTLTTGVRYFPTAGNVSGSGNNTIDWNFGQRPFAYTPPSGYVAVNTFNLATGTVTTSGTFTGNASADGPVVYLNGIPTAMTINGNAVTFGTNADKLAIGLKVRSSSSSYNASGSNTYSVSTTGATFKNANAQGNP